MANPIRSVLTGIFADAVAAVDPAHAVRRNVVVASGRMRLGSMDVPLDGPGRILVIAFGKAAPAMVSGFSDAVAGATLDGFAAAPVPEPCPLPLVAAGHPEPDEGSVAAGRRALSLAASAGPDDLVVCLVSGGGSALLEVPAAGISLEDLILTGRALIRSGADIAAINTVRKHLSGVKGGRLGAAAGRARLITLVLSDVVGDPIDVIASGPTVPDPTTYRDALDVLDRFDLVRSIPESVVRHLVAGASGAVPETPKVAHPRHELGLVGSGLVAAEAAAESARRRGYASRVVTTHLEGEARLAAASALDAAEEPGEICVFAGETTVTVTGDGLGGRNQEASLAAAIEIEGTAFTFLAAGTDGIDGPTEAAGAVVDGRTVARGAGSGLDAHESLRRNDAFRFLDAAGDLLVTGPTGTNVADLWMVHHGA